MQGLSEILVTFETKCILRTLVQYILYSAGDAALHVHAICLL